MKLALTELWWREHYGEPTKEDIKSHFIVESYINLDEFYSCNHFENKINKSRINFLKKPIYNNKKLTLEIIDSFRLYNYEICIKKTFWLNIFLRKCKKYILENKIKNILYTNKLNLNKDVIKYINSFY